MCMQETRWKGSKPTCVRGSIGLLFYHGVDGRRNRLGVVLKEQYVKSVLEVRRVSDRVMSMKLENDW